MRKIKEDAASLAATSYEEIKSSIIHGGFQPGERLTELGMSEQLGVSRTPIREALRQLSYEGYLTQLSNGGYAIFQLTKGDIVEILEVRRALEGEACRLAAEHITERQRHELIENFQRYTTLHEIADHEERKRVFMQLDIEFHDDILKIAGNSRIIKLEGSLQDRMFRFRLAYASEEDRVKECVEQHRNILEAITHKDVEAAGFYGRDHLTRIERLIDQLL